MPVGKCVVLLVAFLWTLNKSDAVDCVYKEMCILPCSFQAGAEVVIHWIMVEGNPQVQVHSYYHGADQLGLQNQRFSGRTSLFKDQISKGNASLRLTGVQIQDQGLYKCYTSTITGNKETMIDVNVDAPVNKINIQQVENRITCSSEGIYPKPQLTWTTNPLSNVTLQPVTTVPPTEQLYTISSSLIVSDKDLDYICTISTVRHKKRATLFKQTNISGLNTETTIPCTSIKTPQKNLIWRFNDSQLILTRTSNADTVTEEWSQKVKEVSDSGSLILQHLSSNQKGIYTCELHNEEGTYVTNTILTIAESQGTSDTTAIAVGVVVCLLLLVAVVLVLLYFKIYKPCTRKKKETRKENGTQPEDEPLKMT